MIKQIRFLNTEEAIAANVATDDNGLESINGKVKIENTLRQLINVKTWVVVSSELIRGWSHDPANRLTKMLTKIRLLKIISLLL